MHGISLYRKRWQWYTHGGGLPCCCGAYIWSYGQGGNSDDCVQQRPFVRGYPRPAL